MSDDEIKYQSFNNVNMKAGKQCLDMLEYFTTCEDA